MEYFSQEISMGLSIGCLTMDFYEVSMRCL